MSWELFEKPKKQIKKPIRIEFIHQVEAIKALIRAGWTKRMLINFLSEELHKEIDNHF